MEAWEQFIDPENENVGVAPIGPIILMRTAGHRYHCHYSRVSYGIMRVGLQVKVHFHTNESTSYINFGMMSIFL